LAGSAVRKGGSETTRSLALKYRNYGSQMVDYSFTLASSANRIRFMLFRRSNISYFSNSLNSMTSKKYSSAAHRGANKFIQKRNEVKSKTLKERKKKLASHQF
jgi:hypothetical protein